MSVINDNKFILLLMTHLVRSGAVIERAMHLLEPNDFDRVTEANSRLIWAISKQWYTQHGKTIPKEYLTMELDNKFKELSSEFSSENIAAAHQDVHVIYAMDESVLVPDHMTRLLQEFLDERKLKPIISNLGLSEPGADFNELMTQLTNIHNATRVAPMASMDQLFTPEGIEFKNSVRHPTGLQMIDELMGGGTAPGELYGLLGPTGGGKTTVSSMLANEIARGGQNVCLFSYETEIVPQVSNKLYGYAGKIPRDVFKHVKSLPDLPITYRDALFKSFAEYGSRMKMVDMKKNTSRGMGVGGVPELRAQLKMYHDNGVHIDVFIVDQLLAMVDSWIVAHGKDVNNRRAYLQQFTEEMRDVVQAGSMNCCGFVLHQVDNVAKKASPMRRPNKGDAAEDKSFDNNMHFCVQLGTKDNKNRCWLAVPKAREDEESAIIVELDKTYWQFNYTPGKYSASTAGFIDNNVEQTSRNIPTTTEIDNDPSDIT